MATPDSGSEENVISLELAKKLHLGIDECQKKSFQMANGQVVSCCGRTVVSCIFGSEFHMGHTGIESAFYVFEKLASSLIMSLGFLERTETLTSHRSRLIDLSPPRLCIPRIQAIGETQKRVLCTVGDEEAQAVADSGSEVDLFSLDYAQRRAFVIKPKRLWLMFADGSVAQTVGSTTVRLYIGPYDPALENVSRTVSLAIDDAAEAISSLDLNEDGGITADEGKVSRSHNDMSSDTQLRKILEVEFFVLEGMSAEVLIGEDTLESLEVFTHHKAHFYDLSMDETDTAELNRIVLLDGAYRTINEAKKKIFSWKDRHFRKKSREPDKGQNKYFNF
jgi:hypothetical protein